MRTPPEYKVAKTATGLEISVELVPCLKDQLSVTIEGCNLRIQTELDDLSLFHEVIELPAGYDLSRASADCRQGVLRITVPRAFLWN
jgi:HSP20 family molecular chaperone IbpA